MKEDKYLIKDSDWEPYAGEIYRLIEFSEARIINGKVVAKNLTTPYGFVVFETPKYKGLIKGAIVHKTDFLHMSEAIHEVEDNEIIFSWSKNFVSQRKLKFFSKLLPRLMIMIVPKDGYRIQTDPKFHPEMDLLTRTRSYGPIKTWEPIE